MQANERENHTVYDGWRERILGGVAACMIKAKSTGVCNEKFDDW